MPAKKNDKPARNARSQTVMPTRRDLHFTLPADRVHDWTGSGVQFTHLMNAMSLVIPVGERFFIDAVRHYRDRITDPELRRRPPPLSARKPCTGASMMNTTR